MSVQLLFANNAGSTLAGAITAGALSLSLAPGGGAKFSAPGAGQAFNGTLTDAATGLIQEIVQVTNITGDVLTVIRAQEGTTALSWLSGDLFQQLITAGDLLAMQQLATVSAARIVTLSGAFTMTTADKSIGFNRTSGVATSSGTLPASAIGQEYNFEDLAGNFNAFPVTVTYPGGQTGPEGAATQVLNINKQCAHFRYYGSNIWSFKP
jgi:hypothetical protein